MFLRIALFKTNLLLPHAPFALTATQLFHGTTTYQSFHGYFCMENAARAKKQFLFYIH